MSTASAPHRRRTTASGQRALPYVDGNRAWKRMACMTVSSFGTQFLWSAEMSQATPFLLSLGISKSRVALVLMAGPLSGLFTQPIVGLYADKNPHRLGRRRPFIIQGGLCVLVSLSTFAWCQEVAGIVAESGSQAHQNLSAFLAVVSFYALDISINIVTVCNKCLMIDVLPAGEQQLANAYAARFSGVSAVLTMLISLLDLPHLFKTTTSQLKLIAYIGGPVFVVSHLVMCVTVHEKRFVPGPAASSSGDAAAADDQARGAIWKAMSNMVTRFWEVWRSLDGTLVQPLCWIELWAWLGWFPLIFYSTTWIGDTWRRTSGETDDEQATRVGAIGLLVHSLLSLLGWILIPALVAHFRHRKYGGRSDGSRSLVDLWGYSQIAFGALLLLSPFCENSVPLSVLLIGACGVPWAITAWAPFALLAEAILEKPEWGDDDATEAEDTSQRLLAESVPVSRPNGEAASGHPMIPLQPLSSSSSSSSSPSTLTDRSEPGADLASSLQLDGSAGSDAESETEGLIMEEQSYGHHHHQIGKAGSSSSSNQVPVAGTVLGIHNVFIVIPQFIISFISSVLFKFLEPGSSEPTSADPPAALRTHTLSEIGWIFT
ncbi:hypothetical protein PCASD_25420 [Puccinia coronata f. sp. avenae]|uniref:Major facilitator superfamily (MFS) profile domain-containing protein n=1 Tax=Puccinia coronata f. sp. avenae TaxID=200324 RepID=A0A2N5S1I9_9BASI|nr:hypothetical protein PCASD_25420 [Puccinia coronata f. sp. avenae]